MHASYRQMRYKEALGNIMKSTLSNATRSSLYDSLEILYFFNIILVHSKYFISFTRLFYLHQMSIAKLIYRS